jgi:hypothetical protein
MNGSRTTYGSRLHPFDVTMVALAEVLDGGPGPNILIQD